MNYLTLLLTHRPRFVQRMAWGGLLTCTLLIALFHPLLASEVAPGEPPAPYTNTPSIAAASPTQRSGLTVNPQKREESRQFFQTNYVSVDPAAHHWNGDQETCNAGTTTPEFRDAIALRINYYRAMAGLPADVSFNDEYTAKAQQAALMMSANDTLSHAPSADWVCYSEAGATAASSSNLYLGVFGPAAIDGYIEDPGNGNNVVGHRRWILYPQTQFMGVGDIPTTPDYRAANALWVFDDNLWGPRPATREAFVAWPPPGYVPYQVIYPRWSFAYPNADFSSTTVTMTHNGATLPIVLAPVENGYGENTLVWTPDGVSTTQPATDDTYVVMIANVQVANETRSFSYTVTIFDPATGEPPQDTPLQVFLPVIRR